MPHSSSAHTVVDIVANAIGIHVRCSHRRTRPRRRAGFRRSRSLLLGCQNIRTRRWRQDRCRCRTRRVHHAVVHIVANAIGIGSAAQSPPPPKASSWFPSQSQSSWDVRTSALVDGARTVADAALVEFAHAVVDVVADAIGIGVRCAVTAAHAQASSWFPSQSQSPSGMSEHPHS